MGADVVKVEPIDGEDARHYPPHHSDGDHIDGTVFLSTNRNKRSLAVNLKSGGGRAIVHRLTASADVVLESFGPGVSGRLGIDY